MHSHLIWYHSIEALTPRLMPWPPGRGPPDGFSVPEVPSPPVQPLGGQQPAPASPPRLPRLDRARRRARRRRPWLLCSGRWGRGGRLPLGHTGRHGRCGGRSVGTFSPERVPLTFVLLRERLGQLERFADPGTSGGYLRHQQVSSDVGVGTTRILVLMRWAFLTFESVTLVFRNGIFIAKTLYSTSWESLHSATTS